MADLLATHEDRKLEFELTQQIEKATRGVGTARPSYDDSSYVEVIQSFTRFTEQELQNFFKDPSREKDQYLVNYWNIRSSKPVTASAPGTNHIHHFVNGYLVGYEPFKTEELWVPHYTISMRLRYQLDSKQYGGLREVWQTSKQAFLNTRGDCEDHALTLADWLIEMEVDARVVLGTCGKQGHAWVVVFKDDKVYLLEATDKRKRKNWRFYPLASLATEYHPMYMFNREYFWTNMGSELTTNYKSKNWEKKSHFFSS